MTDKVKALPTYTERQERWNSITHFLGFLFGVGATITFICLGKTFDRVFPFIIYTFFMMVMFFNSGFYHSRKLFTKAKAITRIIDHCDIYLFIAATYTPICFFAINNSNIALVLLSLEWIFAIIGVVLNVIDLNNKIIQIVSYIIYLLAGWAIVFFYPFNLGISFEVFIYVLMGGVSYTIGAILYAIGSKNLWFHTVFHFFVLAGAILQFVGLLYLI